MQQQQQRKTNGGENDKGPTWTIYSASQNLPAVLNDPRKGKQSNFLTKTWGDAFIERVDIPKSPYLPDINIHHFDNYMKKICHRYRKHSRTSLGKSNSPNESPNLANSRKLKSLGKKIICI